ncbi:MAG: DUF6486 family protein [Bacteroidales bacterium]|nr:DUF6486 family protein [Bacteroidales bacterium]
MKAPQDSPKKTNVWAVIIQALIAVLSALSGFVAGSCVA